MEFLQLSTMGYINLSELVQGELDQLSIYDLVDPSTLKTRTSLDEMSSKGRKNILTRRTAEVLLFSWCKFNVYTQEC